MAYVSQLTTPMFPINSQYFGRTNIAGMPLLRAAQLLEQHAARGGEEALRNQSTHAAGAQHCFNHVAAALQQHACHWLLLHLVQDRVPTPTLTCQPAPPPPPCKPVHRRQAPAPPDPAQAGPPDRRGPDPLPFQPRP
jgi:hypothetical protein